jgi:hypothetical protein
MLKRAYEKLNENDSPMALRYAIRAISNNDNDLYSKMNGHKIASEIYLKENKIDKYAVHSFKFWELKQEEFKKYIDSNQINNEQKKFLQEKIKEMEGFKEQFLDTKERFEKQFGTNY